MPAGLTLAIYLAMQAASVAGVRAIKKKKNRKPTLRGGLLTVIIPPLSILFNLMRRAKPAEGVTPEEKTAFQQRFAIDTKKGELESMLSRRDRLELFRERSFGYRAVHPGLWFSSTRMENLDRAIGAKREDIKADYTMLGILQKKEEKAGKENYAFVRVEHGRDGALRFGLPYDLSPDLAEELRFMLAKRFGLDPDDKEAFFQSEHRCVEKGGLRPDMSLMVFDVKEHAVVPFGTDMSDELMAKVGKVREDSEKMRKDEGYVNAEGEALSGNYITLDPVGRDTVALNMNGVCLAYAVAGEDGKIRTMSHGALPGDRSATRLASRINERLKGAADMGEWIDRAADIVLSYDNLDFALDRRKEKESVRKQLKERKALRQGILNAPKRAVKGLAKSL